MPRLSDATLKELLSVDVLPKLGGGPVIGWDLDSTVCSTVHRRHMVPLIRAGGEGSPTWDDYSMLCANDEPIAGTVALMTELSLAGYSHVAVSGRSMRAYSLTLEWADTHNVPLSAMVLRPDGDHTPNGTWKVRVLSALRQFGVDIRLFFEDWDQTAHEVYQETGIPVVGINPFDPEPQQQGL